MKRTYLDSWFSIGPHFLCICAGGADVVYEIRFMFSNMGLRRMKNRD